MTASELFGEDIVNTCDVFSRVEELEKDIVFSKDSIARKASSCELTKLLELLAELRDYGHDVEWRDDWYPDSLISDRYFIDYAKNLAKDCGMYNGNEQWPHNCIDWGLAAEQLQRDYTNVLYGSRRFWFRAV